MSPAAEARRIAVVGGGWAGLAAAVHARLAGHEVSLFEMAPHLGGRARAHAHDGVMLDNGQHILIGAYRETLALLRRVGVDPSQALWRSPLQVVYPDGQGLRLPPGSAVPAFVRGVLRWRALPFRDRLALLAWALRWRLQGFRCPAHWTVAVLARTCPPTAYQALIEPLCVAALNTPAEQASAQVLLTVLRDALFGEAGGADLLLPRVSLSDLLPAPACAWLTRAGARLHTAHRVASLELAGVKVRVDGEPFDHVIVATPPGEAARLLASIAPEWSSQARRFTYQPIVTAWIRAPGRRWAHPMMAFHADHGHPAQFGFDLGALGGPAGAFAMVVSGAADWVAAGAEATRAALVAQWREAFPSDREAEVDVFAMRTEKRATFACVPGLHRPAASPHPRVHVAGDYVDGPYPATLEGAVRSGMAAAIAVAGR